MDTGTVFLSSTGSFRMWGEKWRGLLVKPHMQSPQHQRAKIAGLDPSWLDLAFLGRPDFPSRGPKTLLK